MTRRGNGRGGDDVKTVLLTTLLLLTTAAAPLAAAQAEADDAPGLCAQNAASGALLWGGWYVGVVEPANARDTTTLLAVGLAVTALVLVYCTLSTG